MNTIQINMKNPPQIIHLGRRGENLCTEVLFDCSALYEQYGMGSAQLLHLSSHGIVYPVAAVQDGTVVRWRITSCDTACEGIGTCELHWMVNDVIVISAAMKTLVYHSLSGCAGDEPPESSASWVETVLQASQSAQASAQAAKTAPYINENGTWSLYNANIGAYTDSGLPARGETGAAGKDGKDGKDGAKGEQGEKGEKGDKGDSPALSSSVTSSSTAVAANCKAVKTAYDKAVSAETAANAKQFVLLSDSDTALSVGSTLTLSDDCRNYSAVFIYLYAMAANGSRIFMLSDNRNYLLSDAGKSSNYISGSLFYSTSYYACAGLSVSADGRTLTVDELSCTGYSSIRGCKIFGLSL